MEVLSCPLSPPYSVPSPSTVRLPPLLRPCIVDPAPARSSQYTMKGPRVPVPVLVGVVHNPVSGHGRISTRPPYPVLTLSTTDVVLDLPFPEDLGRRMEGSPVERPQVVHPPLTRTHRSDGTPGRYCTRSTFNPFFPSVRPSSSCRPSPRSRKGLSLLGSHVYTGAVCCVRVCCARASIRDVCVYVSTSTYTYSK